MVHADTGAQQSGERGPETSPEAEVTERLHDLGLAGLGHQIQRSVGQVARSTASFWEKWTT